MGGCRLLYFVKSKNFAVLLCFYVNTFIFIFPEMAGRGGYSLLSHPLNPPLARSNQGR